MLADILDDDSLGEEGNGNFFDQDDLTVANYNDYASVKDACGCVFIRLMNQYQSTGWHQAVVMGLMI